MKLVTVVCSLLCLLPAGLLAMPNMDTRQAPLIKEPAIGLPAGPSAGPLDRDAFIWQEIASPLPYGEANRRMLEGLRRCSQFAVETRSETEKSVHDVFFRVGENRSPWPIGRIELISRKQGAQVGLGQNKQFSMGSGKFQKMWAGYLDERYECPPAPGHHPGGMRHP